MDAQDARRQNLVPMAHQSEVAAIIAGNVFLAVRKFLTVAEQLLEIAEAARHRLPPGIDDARIGQHELDQTDVAEIVRHLVDEDARPLRWTAVSVRYFSASAAMSVSVRRSITAG